MGTIILKTKVREYVRTMAAIEAFPPILQVAGGKKLCHPMGLLGRKM